MQHPSENQPNIWHGKWDDFFARTQDLPSPERTRDFLAALPTGARILDFGCGSGRWAAAFLRDRPDLTIDVLDQFVDKANLLPEPWPGQKFQQPFTDFVADALYDGIWAYAALFFLHPPEFFTIFTRLVDALHVGGVIEFTMVDACANTQAAKFFGMPENAMQQLLQQHALTVQHRTRQEDAKYGPQRLIIPTIQLRAIKQKRRGTE